MSDNDRYKHNRIESTALPYVSNASITEARPHWVDGSHDTLASIRGWTERRPGFTAFTADNYAIPITRWYTWQKWDGSFFVMISSNNGAGSTQIYKLKVGTDATFQSIATVGSTGPFDFVEANNNVYMGDGDSTLRYDGTNSFQWGVVGPGTSVPTTSNASSGLVPATISHKYIYAYGVSATGYISDVSGPSVAITTPLRQWDITGARSIDTQVDLVHIYRTEDGGSVYLEIPASPIANPGSGAWTVRDNAADTSLLQSSPAPFPGVNSPPPKLKGLKFWNGRIWGFKEDSVYFSTYEECTTSVPTECFGTKLTNSFSFGAQVLGLGVTPDFLVVFTTRGIHKIGGDSLNTFTRSTLSKVMGVRNHMAIAEYDDHLSWLDISNTIQSTDGYTIAKDDISLPIRPDIASIDHSQAQLTAYTTGTYRWLVLCDGGAQKLRVFDINMSQWNPPWNVSNIHSVYSGQTAAGTVQLFLGRNNKPLVLDTTLNRDESVAFTAELYTNLFSINKENPTSSGVMQYVSVERNAVELADVAYLTDEDYRTGTYTSIFANETDASNRTPGTDLVEKWYGANTPSAQRVSAYFKWDAENSRFVIYALDITYQRQN